jgi:hypothetical protein
MIVTKDDERGLELLFLPPFVVALGAVACCKKSALVQPNT